MSEKDWLRYPRLSLDLRYSTLQMVGVSDDVNEYAIALRDTEDKLRRCPKKVRLGQASGFWDRGLLNRDC